MLYIYFILIIYFNLYNNAIVYKLVIEYINNILLYGIYIYI